MFKTSIIILNAIYLLSLKRAHVHSKTNCNSDRVDYTKRGIPPRGGGVLPEKLGGGVRPASQNPYPIYDQNLRYSLPYLLVVIKDYESEFDAV